MAQKTKKQKSMPQAFEQAASELDGIVETNVFYERVAELYGRKPSSLKSRLSNHFKMEGSEHAIRIDRKHVAPRAWAMNGIQWRVPLTAEEIELQGWDIHPAMMGYTPRRVQLSELTFLDQSGAPIQSQLAIIEEELDSVFGPTTSQFDLLQMEEWFDREGFVAGDALLLSIHDWDARQYQLIREPAGTWEEDEIETQNQALADAFFAQLESSRSAYVHLSTGIPAAYLQRPKEEACPPDHWGIVVYRDGRLDCRSHDLIYCESDFSTLDILLHRWIEAGFIEAHEPDIPDELTEEEARAVYRFKVELAHRKQVWRIVELQGGQTLAELDRELRCIFGHSTFDHLGGFWKIFPKGKNKRSYREIELATIYPDVSEGEGECEDLCIGAAGLSPKDRLKYVYDFGDWIEHIITLEAILDEPEEGAEYPRVIDQNPLHKRYCTPCKENGHKNLSTYTCQTCHEDEGKKVYLCDECSEQHYESGHWVQERLS